MAYLIVDEVIADLPMERDPFEAAGQPIPSELPYNDDKVWIQMDSLFSLLNDPRLWLPGFR